MGTKYSGPSRPGGPIVPESHWTRSPEETSRPPRESEEIRLLDEHLKLRADGLEPKGRRFDALKRLKAELQRAISNEVSLAEPPHVFGSYARGTMIGPNRQNDFDLLLVVEPTAHGNWRTQESGPRNALERLRDVIAHEPRFADCEVRVDRNAVRVSTTDGSVDLVPAFRHPLGGYEIPDTSGGQSWIRTDPRMFKRYFDAADKTHSGKVVRVARLAKQWNEAEGHRLKSFHLENMVLTHFRNRSPRTDSSESEELRDFFRELPVYLQNHSRDPVNGERVDGYLDESEYQHVIRAAQRAHEAMVDSAAAAERRNYTRAASLLDEVLGF